MGMEKKCRACLSPEAAGLFCWNANVGEKMTYAELFHQITKVNQDFQQLDLICEECGAFLREIINFVQRAKVSDKLLRREALELSKKKFREKHLEIPPAKEEEICSETNSQNDGTVEWIEDEDEVSEGSIANSLKEESVEWVVDEGDEFIELSKETIGKCSTDGSEIKFEVVDVFEKHPFVEHLLPEPKDGGDDGDGGDDDDTVEWEPKENKKRKAAKTTNDDDWKPRRNKKRKATKTTNDDEWEPKENKKPKTANDDNWEPQENKKPKAASPTFKCDYCDQRFKTLSSKRRHIVIHNAKGLLCDFCQRTFMDLYSLNKHKKTHAQNRNRDHACNLCELKFLSLSALKGHMEIHDAKRQKRYPCDQCDKAFYQRGALNVHRRIHTGNLVTCELCGKRYPRLVDLEIHMRGHTGERPFKCSTCGETFKYSSTLYTHVRREHFGLPFKCGFCSMQFKDRQSMMDHRIVHKILVYKCVICDKEMIKKNRLKDHIRSAHAIGNPDDLEELIISCKADVKSRITRRYTIKDEKYNIEEGKPNPSPRRLQKIKKDSEDLELE